jgi:hypothetical protein
MMLQHTSWSPTLAAVLLAAAFTMAACTPREDVPPGPVKVEVRQVDGKYQLYRGGTPYYIKGAGLEFGPVHKLAKHGGNSFRTWRTENGRDSGQAVLDSAAKHGLTVSMGLEIARERPGSGRGYFNFDYDDSAAVAEQLERVRAEVLKYKDHPALLMWGIGNELNLRSTNPRVWDAVNEISLMIHEVDPNHPTTTMLAGLSPELIADLRERAPDLDLLSFQSYADIVNLPRHIQEAGWDGPYVVTEWGASGHWEVARTSWDAPIENHSSLKADLYLERYNTVIRPDTTQCLGSYVFLWEQKQERTPTWYGMFLKTGEETESIDAMHYAWNGTWPENRSPRMDSTLLAGLTAYDSGVLQAGQTASAAAYVQDPDGDSLTYAWEVKPESTDLGDGGDDESEPETMQGLLTPADAPAVTLTAPATPGPYRLFVYVYDGRGSAAHANIPFFVEE